MSNQSSTIVQRLWNYCNVLRDEGVAFIKLELIDRLFLNELVATLQVYHPECWQTRRETKTPGSEKSRASGTRRC
jgi:hypothetical protein